VCEALVENLKDYIEVRQILFVVYGRSLKLDCNHNFYLNKFYRNTSIQKRPNYYTNTCIYSEDVAAGEMLSLGKL
jgi:hypothetical protein